MSIDAAPCKWREACGSVGPMKRAAVLMCLLLAGCSKQDECTSDDVGTLDCDAMCRNYCDKLRECGVTASDTCVDDCRTVTESGSSTTTYTCVINTECANISNCGI